MTLVLEAIVSIGLLVCVFCIWALIANEITFRQRGRMLENVFAGPSWKELQHATFDAVEYDKHFHSVLFLRNPRKLYGQHAWLMDKQETY